jgi:mannitol-1-phosphate 5-dehydrogenase
MVGIGGGAIQLGLWSLYAAKSGMKIVLAEVDAGKVGAIRKNGNRYSVNIAGFDRITGVTVGPVEIYNPGVPTERRRIVAALGMANDIVTAVPAVSIYETGGVASLLREGLSSRNPKRPVAVYASENQVGAARILEKLVFPAGRPDRIRFLDTVIERMGGPHFDRAMIGKLGLKRLTRRSPEAFLVEDFDKIVVEAHGLKGGFRSGFARFQAVRDIGVYEERKLYGHNAVHSLLGFLGKMKGYRYMSQYGGDPDFGFIGVDALRYETGGWFKPKYAKSGEETATEAGYEVWVEGLCRRIINPYLYDLVDRVARDPGRKLAWDDRLAGVMRNATAAGIVPRRYALGVAAGLILTGPKGETKKSALARLKAMWGNGDQGVVGKLLALVGPAHDAIKGWAGRGSLWAYLKNDSKHVIPEPLP